MPYIIEKEEKSNRFINSIEAQRNAQAKGSPYNSRASFFIINYIVNIFK